MVRWPKLAPTAQDLRVGRRQALVLDEACELIAAQEASLAYPGHSHTPGGLWMLQVRMLWVATDLCFISMCYTKDLRRGTSHPMSAEAILDGMASWISLPVRRGVSRRCVSPPASHRASQGSLCSQSVTDANANAMYGHRLVRIRLLGRLMPIIRMQLRSSRLLGYLRDSWLLTNILGVRKSGNDSHSTSPNEHAIEGCLFCLKYSAAENVIMLEDDSFFVRYDNFPASPGHIEIVPKRHVESFFELSAEEVAKAYALMRRAKNELNKQYHPDGYTIGVNEGDASGRTVKHLHIHLIPRHDGDVDDPRGGIRQVVPNWDPDLWSSGRSLQETHA